MPLPPRFAWTVDEAAARLDRAPADVIGYAIQGKLELVASLPPWETAGGEGYGLTAIPPEAVLTMFRRDGTGPRQAMVFTSEPLIPATIGSVFPARQAGSVSSGQTFLFSPRILIGSRKNMT